MLVETLLTVSFNIFSGLFRSNSLTICSSPMSNRMVLIICEHDISWTNHSRWQSTIKIGGRVHCKASLQFNKTGTDHKNICKVCRLRVAYLKAVFALKRGPMVVWPDSAKFCHFGKSLQVFGYFLTVYFLFGKILSLLWQNCDIIVGNGQTLKNNLTIWSHWPLVSLSSNVLLFGN